MSVRPSVSPWMNFEEANTQVKRKTSKFITYKGLNTIFKPEINAFLIGDVYISCLCEGNFTDTERKHVLNNYLNQFMGNRDPKSVQKKYCLVIVADSEESDGNKCPLCSGGLLERFVHSRWGKGLLQDARLSTYGTGHLSLAQLRDAVARAAQEAQRAREEVLRAWKEWTPSFCIHWWKLEYDLATRETDRAEMVAATTWKFDEWDVSEWD